MKNFDYHISTDIYFGKGQISKLGDNIASIGKKILLVYGGGSIKKSGLYDQVISQLDRAGVKVYELSGVEPNPRIESVRKGVKICLDNNIDAVLAVGGGSCAAGTVHSAMNTKKFTGVREDAAPT